MMPMKVNSQNLRLHDEQVKFRMIILILKNNKFLVTERALSSSDLK